MAVRHEFSFGNDLGGVRDHAIDLRHLYSHRGKLGLLSLGDVDGHPFRGNQWTGTSGLPESDPLHPSKRIERLKTLLPKASGAADTAFLLPDGSRLTIPKQYRGGTRGFWFHEGAIGQYGYSVEGVVNHLGVVRYAGD